MHRYNVASKPRQQPRSDFLSSFLPWSGRKKEGKKREPGNEVAKAIGSLRDGNGNDNDKAGKK